MTAGPPELPGGFASRDGIGSSALIAARRAQELRTVPAFDPTLIMIVEGTKEVGGAGGVTALGRDRFLAMRAGSQVDIGNLPSMASGLYRALAVSFAKETLEAFARLYPTRISREPATQAWLALPPCGALKQAVLHAHSGFRDTSLPNDALRHRLIEILILLADLGCCWPLPGLESSAEKVRVMISARPAAPWAASDAAQVLGISESALRRRLASEGTSFRSILSEIRLTTGLMLLQTSSDSVAGIALACGYESPSRFSEKFQARFGTLPSQLRNG